MMRLHIKMLLFAAVLVCGGYAHNAQAGAPGVEISAAPASHQGISAQNTTHLAINLTPDRSELIRLHRDAASVIIGNPAHVNAMAENSRTIVLVPRQTGTTHMTILDKDGHIIMQRHVIVGGGVKNYVRIRRACKDDSCIKTQTFYCPGACHEIAQPSMTTQTASAQPAPVPAALSGGYYESHYDPADDNEMAP